MTKSDDCSLLPDRLAVVRKEAMRVLNAADAFGIFPTPVAQILDTARVTLAPENAFNEGIIKKFRRKFGETLKRALSKVRGILDATARIIYIDQSLLIVKQTFLKLHEAGHSYMPWQRKLYSAVEDCEKTIDPELADAFDREANVFASEVLFQCDSFTNEAADHKFGIMTPIKLSTKYGSSIYAAIRRYVSTNHRTCAVLVLNKPILAEDDGFIATLRRTEVSKTFRQQFGNVAWPERFTPDDQIGAMVPIGSKHMSYPRIIVLEDANGISHECIAEAFTQSYQVFILIHSENKLTRTSIVVSAH